MLGAKRLFNGHEKGRYTKAVIQEGKVKRRLHRVVLSGTTKPKPNRTPTVKIGKVLYVKYFKPNQSVKEVQEIVEKALEPVFYLHFIIFSAYFSSYVVRRSSGVLRKA